LILAILILEATSQLVALLVQLELVQLELRFVLSQSTVAQFMQEKLQSAAIRESSLFIASFATCMQCSRYSGRSILK